MCSFSRDKCYISIFLSHLKAVISMREGTKVIFFEGELEKMSAQNKKKLDE